MVGWYKEAFFRLFEASRKNTKSGISKLAQQSMVNCIIHKWVVQSIYYMIIYWYDDKPIVIYNLGASSS